MSQPVLHCTMTATAQISWSPTASLIKHNKPEFWTGKSKQTSTRIIAKICTPRPLLPLPWGNPLLLLDPAIPATQHAHQSSQCSLTRHRSSQRALTWVMLSRSRSVTHLSVSVS
jgi:hypothetical protein